MKTTIQSNKIQFLRSTFFILITLVFASNPLFSQFNKEKKQLVDSINGLALTIRTGENDIVKFNANEMLIETLYNTLNQKDRNSYPFDSIKDLSYISPSDRAFNLFSWTLKKEDGNYENFGILQTDNPKTDRAVIFSLKDKSNEYYNPEGTIGDADHWFGAVYYKVLPSVINKKKYYTLLGWSGCNNFKQRKVIEVLSFRANGTPVFGSKIFKKYTNKVAARVVFEYSKLASMALLYDKQTYRVTTGKRDPKTKRMISKEITADMIVFDRLAPLNDNMTGVPEFSVPETNIIDAFIPTQGRWTFVSDIEVRNRIRKNEGKPKVNFQNKTIYKKTKKIKK